MYNDIKITRNSNMLFRELPANDATSGISGSSSAKMIHAVPMRGCLVADCRRLETDYSTVLTFDSAVVGRGTTTPVEILEVFILFSGRSLHHISVLFQISAFASLKAEHHRWPMAASVRLSQQCASSTSI